jgi:transcriptional regulator GlxA family with amidase domain
MNDSVSSMQVAVVVYNGVFDSGLTSIFDVLDNANALGGQIHEPPTWNVTMVGAAPQVRTGAGLVVAPEPFEAAETADLLVVPALAGSDPKALVDHVGGDVSLPVRNLITRMRNRGTTIASACTGTFFLAETGVLDGARATTTWWLSPVVAASRNENHVTVPFSCSASSCAPRSIAATSSAYSGLASMRTNKPTFM